MIDLGLARISRLLLQSPQTWKAIHVAGTNGKGSICAYLSAMLHASGSSVGRFTSPHLIDRWDCVTINEQPVSETLFRDVEDLVKQRNEDGQIQATPFELLAATAFEILEREKVDFGVIEVGLGGKLDATNAMKQKAVTVISKIGLDHQGFLGHTIEEIALHKAGIMREGIPCVVDGSNQTSVLDVIRGYAEEVGVDVVSPSVAPEVKESLSAQGWEPHQIGNLACAREAFRLAFPEADASWERCASIAKHVHWPGRLQRIDISSITKQQQPVLFDGAHNVQSAEVLAAYVNKHFRPSCQHVTWVLAASQGKDIDGILSLLLRPGDQVVAVRFGPADGMPWVKAADPSYILEKARQYGLDKDGLYNANSNLADALCHAAKVSDGAPMVIAGSLYLVSDTLRLLRDHKALS
ncbi:Dihydrofolate synthetase [Pleurostoma richardsiae]|uniref:Dihydrofolate synthetase n=1 Tax=Pleurostoma richardsiae TaxID=41990 RepID=A0AA38S5D7_9PEZI|nr:Dihydrofolate synthetase [Pleurostoma richardsiae]